MVHAGIGSFSDVIASLLLWIASVSTYDMPAHHPSVSFVSEQELRSMACEGNQCPVVGFYHIERATIYLREELGESGLDLCGISVLVHELVHHMQHGNKHQERFADYSSRVRYALREQEAHSIQSVYIRQFPYRYRPREQTISYGYDPERRGVAGTKDEPRYYMTRGCILDLNPSPSPLLSLAP